MLLKKILAAGVIAAGIVGLLGGGSVFAESRPYTSGEWLNYDGDEYTYRAICISQDTDYDGAPITVEMRSSKNAAQFTTDDLSEDNQEYSRCVFDAMSYGDGDDYGDYRARFILPMGVEGARVENVLDGEQEDGEGHIYRGIVTWLLLDDANISNKYLRSYGQTAMRIERLSGSIVFDANGGSGTMDPIRGITPGSGMSLPSNTFTWDENHLFLGWNTEPDGSGVSYSNYDYVSDIGVGELVLYAQWKNWAKISFYTNGGSGTMSPLENAEAGSVITLPINTMTRTGYRFVGWNTESNGTGVAYEDGATITVPSAHDLLLFAQWRENKAVLDFGSNVNVKIKKLANPTANVTSYSYADENIKAIKEADNLPEGFDATDSRYIISSSSVSVSPMPIYAWFDDSDSDSDGVGDGVIYLFTEADAIRGGSSMSMMFTRMNSLADISGLSEWDVSGTTDMSGMFEESAGSLASVSALSSWDTSGVTNMSNLFRNMTSSTSALTDVSGLAGWNTANVTNMSSMFRGASSLVDISSLAGWNTIKVSSMNNMFEGASSLVDISSLAGWRTSNVTNMKYMFNRASSIIDISALSAWNTSRVDDMTGMFSNMRSLSNISALSNWNTIVVTKMGAMFAYDAALTDISALSTWYTWRVTDMSSMFAGTGITNVDALEPKTHEGRSYQSWGVSKVTDMSLMFYEASALADISALAGWETNSAEYMYSMFQGTSITNVDALERKKVSGHMVWDMPHVISIDDMFSYDASLTDISALSSWDTSNISSMGGLFYFDSSLVDISPLSHWNTSNVTEMRHMFGLTGITNVDALETLQHDGDNYVSWNVSGVEYMIGMFSGARNLADISALSSWNVSSVVSMSGMFFEVPARPLPSWYN